MNINNNRKTASPAEFQVLGFGHNNHTLSLHSSSIEVQIHTHRHALETWYQRQRPATKDFILYDSIYMNYPESANA